MHRHPETDAMLGAVAAFLREVCAPALVGRDAFLARVAANAVEIAAREAREGPAAVKAEADALKTLMGRSEGDLEDLRAALCAQIISGERDAEDPALLDTLLTIAVRRVRLEQPAYASLERAPCA